MPASFGNSEGPELDHDLACLGSIEATSSIDRACATAISGRRAVRALGDWARRFQLTESELQLLWQLRLATHEGIDQTALANSLVFSPAQISTNIERLRSTGLIDSHAAAGDRRRHPWRLSVAGRQLVEQLLAAANALRVDGSTHSLTHSDGTHSPEAAA